MKKIIIIFILITGLYSIAEAQLVQSNFQGVLVPQYIASGTSTRLPYIFRQCDRTSAESEIQILH
ncbi:MAG: hypothetical protein IPI04_18555 [Ignavibacteria bacterium]|nr:hypothetical protein [Ignavibacteria bacterium]